MALVTIAEASQRLGISIHTIKRRLKRGDLQGQHRATPQGFVWLVEIPDSGLRSDMGTPNVINGIPNTTSTATPNGVPASIAGEFQRMEELVVTLQSQVKVQQEQLGSKDRQISELHILLQQAQEQIQRMLPAPSRRRWWWPFS